MSARTDLVDDVHEDDWPWTDLVIKADLKLTLQDGGTGEAVDYYLTFRNGWSLRGPCEVAWAEELLADLVPGARELVGAEHWAQVARNLCGLLRPPPPHKAQPVTVRLGAKADTAVTADGHEVTWIGLHAI